MRSTDSLHIIDDGWTAIQRRYEQGRSTPCRGGIWTRLWRLAASLADRIANGEGEATPCRFDHEIVRIRIDGVTFVHWEQCSNRDPINRTLHIEFTFTSLTAKFNLDPSCSVVGGCEDDYRRDIQMMTRLGYTAMAAMCDQDGIACTPRDEIYLGTMRLATQAESIAKSRSVSSVTHRTPLSSAYYTLNDVDVPFASSDIPMVMSARLLGIQTSNGEERPARLSLTPLRVDGPSNFSSPIEVMRAITASASSGAASNAVPWTL
jgi:hypothetical protein